MPRTALNELNVHVFQANNYGRRISDQASLINVFSLFVNVQKKYHSRDTRLMKDYIVATRTMISRNNMCLL